MTTEQKLKIAIDLIQMFKSPFIVTENNWHDKTIDDVLAQISSPTEERKAREWFWGIDKDSGIMTVIVDRKNLDKLIDPIRVREVLEGDQ